jgi:hypothetical protein
MKYDAVLKVRLESSLKESFKKKYGNGMSEHVRNLLIRDLDVEFEEVKK